MTSTAPRPPEEPSASAAPDREIIEIHFQVEPGCHHWRLDRYLQLKIKRLSRTRIARVIREALTVNDLPVRKPGLRLNRGDRILIRRPAPEEPVVPRDIKVLAEGPGYLAIDKPAGLPVHPTAHYLKNTLTGVVRERFGENSGLNMAHRLDRETSGVVLFGRDPPATRALKLAFRDGRVAKRYLAIVKGDLDAPCVVEQPIGPAIGSAIRIRMGVRPDGQPARTHFRPLRQFGTHTLVEARPETGRQHQIRVHLEWLGLPVVGDKLYGHPDDFFLTLVEDGLTPALRKTLALDRHALHAAAIRFPVPDDSGREAEVAAPLPEDLENLLARLGALGAI